MADDGAVPEGLDVLRWFVPLFAGVAAVLALVIEAGTPAENMLAVGGVIPVVVWAWRGMPTLLLVAIVSGVQLFALRSGELEPLFFQLSVVALVAGGWEPSRLAAIAGCVVAAATPAAVEALFPDDIRYGIWVMGVVLPWGLARGFRQQMRLAYQLAEARQEIARQAVVDEKRRIARDVHDLVGHGLAIVMLHVTGARHVLRRDIDAADEALADAEAVGRRSMRELRRTLSMLRSSDPSGDSTAPLPGVGELVEVVDTARAAGIDVQFRSEGDVRRIDPVVGLSLHRVASEAVLNVRRHAPRSMTDVTLVVGEDSVTLTVDSVGPMDATDTGADQPRHGIIGMRERMAAVGGELEAGATPTGWLVRCRAPLSAPEAAPTGEATA